MSCVTEASRQTESSDRLRTSGSGEVRGILAPDGRRAFSAYGVFAGIVAESPAGIALPALIERASGTILAADPTFGRDAIVARAKLFVREARTVAEKGRGAYRGRLFVRTDATGTPVFYPTDPGTV